MQTRIPVRLRWTAATVFVAALAALLAGLIAGGRARQQVADEVATDAQLRTALLDSELARFRLMPLTLSDDRDILAALTEGSAAR